MGRDKKKRMEKKPRLGPKPTNKPDKPRIPGERMLGNAILCTPGGIEPADAEKSAFRQVAQKAEECSPFTAVGTLSLGASFNLPSGAQITINATPRRMSDDGPLPPLSPMPHNITRSYMKVLITHFGSEKKLQAMITKTISRLCGDCINFPVAKFASKLFPELKASSFQKWWYPEDDRQMMRKIVINDFYTLVIGKAKKEPITTIGEAENILYEGLKKISEDEWRATKPTQFTPYLGHLPISVRRKIEMERLTKDIEKLGVDDDVEEVVYDDPFQNLRMRYDDMQPSTSSG